MAQNSNLPVSRAALLLPRSGALLPGSGGLLPSSGTGTLLRNPDTAVLSHQFDIAGAEAKLLASKVGAQAAILSDDARAKAEALAGKAATMIADNAPKVRKHARELATTAKTALHDRTLRATLIVRYRTPAAIAAVGCAVLLAGGYVVAQHQASAVAKARIAAFLSRTGLSSSVTYEEISASPFGTATLSKVTLKVPGQGTVARIGSLDISGVDTKGDTLLGVKLAARSVDVPVLQIARNDREATFAAELLGYGYTSLKGNITIAVRFGDADRTLGLTISGDSADLGSLSGSVKLGSVDPSLVGIIMAAAAIPQQANPMALMLEGQAAEQKAIGATFVSLSFNLNMRGFLDRTRALPKTAIPRDIGTAEPSERLGAETRLVQAGLDQEKAKAIETAGDRFLAGDSVRFRTNIDQPLALFRNSGLFGSPAFAFSDPAEFVVATKAEISN
jgi:hypothetical protein